MDDKDGYVVADYIYKGLLENPELSLKDVPYLLDDAIRDLRETKQKESYDWAPFIYTGI
jgi:hypothetical protein